MSATSALLSKPLAVPPTRRKLDVSRITLRVNMTCGLVPALSKSSRHATANKAAVSRLYRLRQSLVRAEHDTAKLFPESHTEVRS